MVQDKIVSEISNIKTNIVKQTGSKTYIILLVIFVILVIIFYLYDKYLGKDIKYHINSLKSKFDNTSNIDVDKVGLSVEYDPPNSDETTSDETISDETISDETHTRGLNKPKICKKGKKIKTGKQVFNISDNIYTYYDAMALCKAYDADLADYKQMTNAYKNKAEWCNYGWTKGQMALYPTQKCTWEKLQQGPKDHRNDCGRPGLNGGYFENPYLRFGVNCYGYKPYPTSKEKEIVKLSSNPYLTQKEREFKNKVDYYKSRKYDYTILPFTKNKWSNV